MHTCIHILQGRSCSFALLSVDGRAECSTVAVPLCPINLVDESTSVYVLLQLPSVTFTASPGTLRLGPSAVREK